MEGFTSRKEAWEWAWTIDTLLLLIFTSCSSLLLPLARVLNKLPTDHYGNGYIAAIFAYHPPAYATGVVTRSFSTSIPNRRLVLTPAIGDNQKWSPQADLPYVKPAQLSHIQTENIERMFIFNFFFITLTLLNGKAKKT